MPADPDLRIIGMANDMYMWKRKDKHKYVTMAKREDFNRMQEYFFDHYIKYSQLYSQCMIVSILGIKAGQRMMNYEYRKISFRFMRAY